MELIYCETLAHPLYVDGVWRLLCKYNNAFIPPLSARNSTCQKNFSNDDIALAEPTEYFDALKSQSFLLVLEGEKVLGFLSFRYGYLPEPLSALRDPQIFPLYVTTIIVDEWMHRKGVARRMYDALMLLYPDKKIRISTRTWSGNISHISLLKKMGFTGPVVIENDRGPGIDTVYFHFCRNEVTE